MRFLNVAVDAWESCATDAAFRRHQRLQRLRGADVLLRSGADRDRASRARRRRAARARPPLPPVRGQVVLGDRGLQLVLGVVRALPRQPVGGPLRVRRLDPLAVNGNVPPAARSSAANSCGKQLPRRLRERLPDAGTRADRAARGERRREQRQQRGDRSRALPRRSRAARSSPAICSAAHDDRRGDDQRGQHDHGSRPGQYCSDACTCSPASLARPFSATSSIRNASACTVPPICLTRSRRRRARCRRSPAGRRRSARAAPS